MTKMGPKIEMYDSTAAIAQIAKMQGWDAPEKVAHTDAEGNPIAMMPMRIELVGREDKD